MPGHNALKELGEPQGAVSGFGGKFCICTASTPGSSDKGVGRGGWAINIGGGSASSRFFVQVSADPDSPTWKYITCSA